MPELCFLHVLLSQNEQMIPPRKETQDEKSAKPPKKRKVGVATPGVANINHNSVHWLKWRYHLAASGVLTCVFVCFVFVLEKENNNRCLGHL